MRAGLFLNIPRECLRNQFGRFRRALDLQDRRRIGPLDFTIRVGRCSCFQTGFRSSLLLNRGTIRTGRTDLRLGRYCSGLSLLLALHCPSGFNPRLNYGTVRDFGIGFGRRSFPDCLEEVESSQSYRQHGCRQNQKGIFSRPIPYPGIQRWFGERPDFPAHTPRRREKRRHGRVSLRAGALRRVCLFLRQAQTKAPVRNSYSLQPDSQRISSAPIGSGGSQLCLPLPLNRASIQSRTLHSASREEAFPAPRRRLRRRRAPAFQKQMSVSSAQKAGIPEHQRCRALAPAGLGSPGAFFGISLPSSRLTAMIALARVNSALNTGCLSDASKYLRSKPDLFVASDR